MPPKNKFNTEDVIEAAFNVLRNQGWLMVSARTIAKELNASTSPIYTSLKSMKNLEDLLFHKAASLLIEYQKVKRTDDEYLNLGVGVIMFAKKEKHLYRFLNDEKYIGLQIKFTESRLEANLQKLADNQISDGLSKNQMKNVLRRSIIFIHGLSDLVNKSFEKHFNNSHENKLETEQDIIQFLSDANIYNFKGTRGMAKINTPIS